MQEPEPGSANSQPARRTVKVPLPSFSQPPRPIEVQAHLAARQMLGDQAQERIRGTQCDLHRQVATVTLVVTEEFFEYHLEACCDRLADEAVAHFRNAFAGERPQASETVHPNPTGAPHNSDVEGQCPSAMCDACGNPTTFAQSYSLTSREVLLTTSYWTNAFRGGLSLLHAKDPTGGAPLLLAIEHNAGQHTGWLLCHACAGPLQFDRIRARRLAELQQSPEEAGTVSPRQVATFAVDAWTQLYGKKPRLPEFSDVLVTGGRNWWQFWK